MKKYKITAHEGGVTIETIVEARSRREAYQKGWEIGFEDVYVEEVEDNG